MVGKVTMGEAQLLLKDIIGRRLARPRRELIWAQLRRQAAVHGFAERDLERFYHYFSVNLKLEKRQYVQPLQRPYNYFPGLRAQPTYDPSDFSWTADLLRNFKTVRKEILDLGAASNPEVQAQNLTDRGRWNVVYFYSGGGQSEETRRACPKTSEILDSIPGVGQAGQTYLSILRGGTHIKQHFGPTNTRLRCHIGLVVPEGPRIRIGNEIHQWGEGECLLFDDSFQHEVWNDGDRDRLVLIIDFWHPELTPAERWAINTARRLRFGLRDFPPGGSSARALGRPGGSAAKAPGRRQRKQERLA
jgi:aspartyl/asparaginyl beta-hydroxylase (cupin superfamily)